MPLVFLVKRGFHSKRNDAEVRRRRRCLPTQVPVSWSQHHLRRAFITFIANWHRLEVLKYAQLKSTQLLKCFLYEETTNFFLSNLLPKSSDVFIRQVSRISLANPHSFCQGKRRVCLIWVATTGSENPTKQLLSPLCYRLHSSRHPKEFS